MKHEERHLGKFYKIQDSEFEKLDPFSDLVEKQYLEQSKVFQEKCLMIRSPALEIISYLKQVDLSRPIYKFILCKKVSHFKN